MRTQNLQNRGGGEFGLPAYVAPELLLSEFSVERGFADSLSGDVWTKAEEENFSR